MRLALNIEHITLLYPYTTIHIHPHTHTHAAPAVHSVHCTTPIHQTLPDKHPQHTGLRGHRTETSGETAHTHTPTHLHDSRQRAPCTCRASPQCSTGAPIGCAPPFVPPHRPTYSVQNLHTLLRYIHTVHGVCITHTQCRDYIVVKHTVCANNAGPSLRFWRQRKICIYTRM